MRVTKAQAAENRARVVDAASHLFRTHGFEGIGLKDVMESAGLTQGGFYKQFASKIDLISEACERAMETAAEHWTDQASANPEDPFGGLIDFYLGSEHRNAIDEGCPVAALGSDAARSSAAVKAPFEAGIRARIDVLEGYMPTAGDNRSREKSMAVFSTLVGALLLSRTINDETLSNELLDSAAKEIRLIAAR